MLDSPEAVLFHYGVSAVKYQELYRSCGVPMLVHFNGFDLSSKLRSEDYARQLREAIPHMAGFVVVANYMRDWLLSNGAEASKIHYIPYGVPVREFKISTNTGNEHCRFLAVGRLTSKKAPEHTIRAFAKCHQAFSNCTLTVIGDRPLRESCSQLVASLGMEDSVTFLGVQTSEQVKLHMSEASVFVQHSITPESGDKEGWPVAIAEAAASGLPIVSTQHASIPEEVIDGETGILVGENDWEAMAQGMLELAKSPDLRQRFGTAARSHISQWDFSNQIGKLEDLVLAISRGPLASPTD